MVGASVQLGWASGACMGSKTPGCQNILETGEVFVIEL